ncbi:hypothetical protein BH18GEM1_BH18GEM1_00920 [soil metagenome]
MRFALIGCGTIAAAHAKAIAATPGADLVAAVDPAKTVRDKAGVAWRCAVFADIATMLDATPVDAACICAPPIHHRQLTVDLLDAGLDVLCEKPLALTVADAETMAACAQDTGRVLMVSSKFRYVDDLMEARRRIVDGEVGRPVLYEITFCARIPAGGGWKMRPELAGGGVVMDNGSHVYDVLSMVQSPPWESLAVVFGPRVVSPDVEDSAEIQFTADGMLVRVALSWSYFTKDLDYLMVQGTEGALGVGWPGGRTRRHGQVEWTPFGTGYDKDTAFARQLEAFVIAVRSRQGRSDLAGAIGAVEFIDRVYRAEREHRRL